MNDDTNLSRRGFLASGFALGIWTLGGFSNAGAGEGREPAAPGFGLWLRFLPDGTLVILSNVADIGQGTQGTLRYIAAEELAMPPGRIRVEQAPVTPEFFNPETKNYASFASFGLRLSLRRTGPACAGARDMLLRAGAAAMGVAAAECTVADAHVRHEASGKALPYTALLRAAALLAPPDRPLRKPRASWTVLGKSIVRADATDRCNGALRYGIDVQRPGTLHACVTHAPTFGGTLRDVDERPALALAGVRRVVRLPGGVAVVADGYWQALQGMRALRPEWTAGPHADFDSERFRLLLREAAARGAGEDFGKDDDARNDPAATALALRDAATVVDLMFDVPFLAHATMEPMNATAEVAGGRAQLWLSTQSALDTQLGVARALGLPPGQVAVYPQPAGGGFGRRLEHAYAIEAALVARAAGRPVKTIWPRETDMRAGGYRPATAARLRIALRGDGMPAALRADVAGPNLLEHSGLSNGPASPNWSATMGWARHQYDIPLLHSNWTRVDHGVPCGYWRSVGASQNVFFLEHALDHCARVAGVDPLAYRRRLFAGNRRRLAFLDALAAHAGWERALPPGRFRGIAVSQGNNALSGHVVELSVPLPGKFVVHRIVAAIDVGVVVNPGAVEAQLMGGTTFGFSAAVFSEITLKDGRVEQGNFDGYSVARMAHMPPLELLVMGTSEHDDPEGAGEEGVASVAPAIANALLAASGVGVARLPLWRAGWELRF